MTTTMQQDEIARNEETFVYFQISSKTFFFKKNSSAVSREERWVQLRDVTIMLCKKLSDDSRFLRSLFPAAHDDM